jgi:hypothetical protein
VSVLSPVLEEVVMQKGRWCRKSMGFAVRLTPVIGVFLFVTNSSLAADGEWSLRLETILMDAYGHDQHVLTVHNQDLVSDPAMNRQTLVNLDTDGGMAYRTEFLYTRGLWGFGVDFFWFTSSQIAPDVLASVDENIGIRSVVFQVPGRQFTALNPGQNLYYMVLEDTDIAAWTADLYARRVLARTERGNVALTLGLRNGDFDNDYRAVVGVQGVSGHRIDSSSNYDRLMGPLVGLVASWKTGRSQFEGAISQSLLLGQMELIRKARDFNGPFSEEPDVQLLESFNKVLDVAIPITELRITWSYRLSRFVNLGLGMHSSTWWDVTVPAGAIPGAETSGQTVHENTIVFYGALAAVEVAF